MVRRNAPSSAIYVTPFLLGAPGRFLAGTPQQTKNAPKRLSLSEGVNTRYHFSSPGPRGARPQPVQKILPRCNRRTCRILNRSRFGAPLRGYLPCPDARFLFSFRKLSFRPALDGTLPFIAFTRVSLAQRGRVCQGGFHFFVAACSPYFPSLHGYVSKFGYGYKPARV